MATNTTFPVGKQARPVKVPTVLQMESVECGAAALSIILGHFGKFVPLEKLRIACGVSRDGLKATNIIKAAREFGLEAKGYAKSIEKLMQVEMPAIIFWNFNHFLVLEGFAKNKVYLSDPAQGRYHVTYEEFDEAYTGVVLTLKPNERFEKGNEKRGLAASLAARIANSKLSIIYILLVSLFLVIPGLVIPSFIQIFIDKYLVNGHADFVMPLLLIMAAVLGINTVLVYLQQYYLLKLETKLALTTSSKFLWHVFHLPISFFTQRYSGEIGNRVSLNDKVAKLLSGDLANAVLNVIIVLFYAILMFSYDILLTLIGIFMAGLNVAALKYVSRARKDGSRLLSNETGKLLGTTTSGISMIETLKASGRENDFFTNWIGYLAKVMNAQQQLGWLTIRLNVLPPLITSLTTTLILGLGALRIMDGEMTLGALVSFTYLMGNFIGPVNQLITVGTMLHETESDMGRIDDVMNYELDEQFKAAEVTATDQQEANQNKLTGYFEMRNVTFGYNTTMPALVENFNLKLKPGSRVALVGGSGSGKSTVAKIASGLYPLWSGEVLFDGKPKSDIPRHVITNSLAVIDQEVLVFNGTVKENISFWDSTIPDKHVIQSARDAAIHDIISVRKDGYDSSVMEGGANFSGGQRQRLEIARALAPNPSILIMDEATSALDPTAEKIVMDNIKKRGCTCLIVAHRLSTIIDCDEIIVMEYGKVVERGTHQGLMKKNGVYAHLIETKINVTYMSAIKDKIYVCAENPFVLDSTGRFWMVLAGEVNVFYTKIDEHGNYTNRLKHLYSAKKGEVLFSLLTPEITETTRLIVFSSEATLLSIDKADLLNVDHFFLKNMIDKWILKTSSVVSTVNAPRVYKPLDEYQISTLGTNTIAFPSTGINWIQLLQGEVSLFAQSTEVSYEQYPDFLAPVSNKLWLKSLTDNTEVRVLSTREMLLQEEVYFLLALSKLEAYFYAQINQIIDVHRTEEVAHLSEKRANDQLALENTLGKIKSVVGGNSSARGLEVNRKRNQHNILFEACQSIGDQIGFKLEEPKYVESHQNNVTNQLHLIAKSSRLRIRRIILRDTWWKEENGPLLAFTKKDKTPVALLQKTSSSYVIKDGLTGEESVVNYDIADSLEPIGYMFFSGFDGKMSSVKRYSHLPSKE